ncbi:MAG TPA: Ig-like domain-containing protein [Candidatus Thermoplasmatota archaeon]|nr:Ig-like domain-containing protein [Candidatus Thermoplasmatota archaeon]
MPRPVPPAPLALALVALLAAPAVLAQGVDAPAPPAGRRVEFDIQPFEDTLYASIDGALRVGFDDRGHLWYTTQAGLVHVDVEAHRRDLYTRVDGLPSSYSVGLALRGDEAYVGTELGIAVVNSTSGKVRAVTMENSPLPDAIVLDLAFDGDELWVGTWFGGVATWNVTSGEWIVKNTSTTSGYPKPVKRIVPGEDAVWVATDGDGLWRRDRETGAWSVLLKDDGLVTNEVRAVLDVGPNLYVGTTKGLQVRRDYAPYAGTPDEWVLFNTTTSEIPDNVVLDLDLVPVEGGGFDLFAATRKGLWQYDGDTGRSATRTQSFGILGDFVLDESYTRYGWAIATQRGVSLQRGGNWTYYVTGPSSAEVLSQGPLSFLFTSASVGDGEPVLWFGSASGVSGYRPPEGDRLGAWLNLGEWTEYPGGPVNWIDTEGDVTWVASNTGVFGFDHATGQWFPQRVVNSRNLAYGLEADRGELWIPLFGDGLIMRNLTTGASRAWDAGSGLSLPDLYLTDARAQGDEIWLGSAVGPIRLDRASGQVLATYTKSDGVPGTGVIYRLLPEGNVVWLGTKDGGLARLDALAGRVTHVWNATNTPGFPEGEVRSLHRAGAYLWIGTTDGLARLRLADGSVKTYRTTDSGLVQSYVNGISSQAGILYLATLSGVARLDIEQDRFLPMHEGPGVAQPRADAPRAPASAALRVGITSPRDLELVAGVYQVTGTASRSNGTVDRVEVQVGDGPWQAAEGTTSWTWSWDTRPLAPNETVTLRARAFSGTSVSRVAEVLAIPLRPPSTPLFVQALPPPNGTAGRPLLLAARATGDEPLSVAAFYRSDETAAYQRLPLVRNGSLYTANVPADAVLEGNLSYYVEARSGGQVARDPADPARAYAVPVVPAPRLSVSLAGPGSLDAPAGKETPVKLRLENTGTTAVVVTLAAEGKRPDWIRVDAREITLPPGLSVEVDAVIAVPATAFDDAWNATFLARDATGVADPAVATVPLRVVGGASSETPTPAPKGKGVPGFEAALLAAAAVVALAARRRRA